jgi:hypothetical protein
MLQVQNRYEDGHFDLYCNHEDFYSDDPMPDVAPSANVQRVVREHFNCSTLAGAEIEDDGGLGSAGAHWESRVFQVGFDPQVLVAHTPAEPVVFFVRAGERASYCVSTIYESKVPSSQGCFCF